MLEAIDRKTAGQEVIERVRAEEPVCGAQFIDLAEALRASLVGKGKKATADEAPPAKMGESADVIRPKDLAERKPPLRATKAA